MPRAGGKIHAERAGKRWLWTLRGADRPCAAVGKGGHAASEGVRCGGTTTACQAPLTRCRLSPTDGAVPGTWENPTAQTLAPAAPIP